MANVCPNCDCVAPIFNHRYRSGYLKGKFKCYPRAIIDGHLIRMYCSRGSMTQAFRQARMRGDVCVPKLYSFCLDGKVYHSK